MLSDCVTRTSLFFKANFLTNVATTICNEEIFFFCVMGRLIYKHKNLITADIKEQIKQSLRISQENTVQISRQVCSTQ